MTAAQERTAALAELKTIRADKAEIEAALKAPKETAAHRQSRDVEAYREAVTVGVDFTPTAVEPEDLRRRLAIAAAAEARAVERLNKATAEAAKEAGAALRPQAEAATQRVADALGPLFAAADAFREIRRGALEAERLGDPRRSQQRTAKFYSGLGESVVLFDPRMLTGWIAAAARGGVALPDAVLADPQIREACRQRSVDLPQPKRRKRSA